MDTILSGIKGVMVRVDDMLVATSHLDILKQVFRRLVKHDVRLNGPKCQFFEAKVKYMGHILSKQGISPVQSKLEAIQQASRPTDVSHLRSFLGMINYELLSGKTKWFWSESCETEFDPDKPIVFCVDASSRGIGAVLSHRMEEWS